MTSHKHKFIFIHIPKTGGLSLKTEFLDRQNLPNEVYGRHKRPASYYKNNKNHFKFTFVRNPWDRFVSCYFYFKKYGRRRGFDKLTGEIINRYSNFNEFCLGLNEALPNIKSWHFKQMSFWIDSPIDFIGRFENFQEDFNTICDKIGIPQRALPHKNKSKHKHYTEYYDDETREIVAEKYAQDIEYFGYKFGE